MKVRAEKISWVARYWTMRLKLYMNGKNDGIALGMAQGVAQGRISMVLDMIKDGLEIGTIARIARMSVEQVTEIGRKAAFE